VAAVRRLTRREYNNTVRDLLGDTTAPAKGFVVDDRRDLFDNNATAAVTALSASQYADAADSLARTAVSSRLAMIAPCAAAKPDDACARDFIASFGKRAYRRPLTDAEQQRLFALFGSARVAQAGDFAGGLRVVLTAMLQSPHFINHVERGSSARDAAGSVALTPYEVAARLSYFLWNTMPDAALTAAADAGKLNAPADVEAQAARMLADPRARDAVLAFFQQWLSLDKVDQLDRDAKLFPMWSAGLRSSLRKETEAFAQYVMWQGDAKLTTLYQAPYSFVNATLGKLYDLNGTTGDALARADLDGTRRSGLLTQGSLLAIAAHYDQTSPVHRGLQVRQSFLCEQVPLPPPNVNVSVPQLDAKLTTRQRYDQHRTDPYCASCHTLLDPLGLGFENYDAIGRYRATENGVAVDASGQISGSQDLDGKFVGAVDLAGRLARSPEAHACMARQWLVYGTGAAGADAACAAGRLGADFTAAGTDIKKLIVAVTRSDAFLRRPALAPEVCR
jgi:hypothetical protein